MNLGRIATNIRPGEMGLWKTITTENVSYTKDGHELIMESEQDSFWFAHRLNCLLRVLNNLSFKMFLDIGGGNGEFSKLLQSKNIEAVLLEPGLKGANNAIANGVKYVINGSLRDAGFKDSSFPAVGLLDVLEHIEDEENFLKEINRILKSNGSLILTVPAFQYLFSDFDRQVGHFRRYTLRDLKNKLIKNGFEIDYETYFFSFIPIPILIGRFIINKFKKKEKRINTGHLSKSGLIGFILTALLWPEQFLIKHKVKIPFGSSCLIVAHKSANYGK